MPFIRDMGFSENPDFARACHEAGLTFIGPSPDAVARVGSKTTARQIAASAERSRRHRDRDVLRTGRVRRRPCRRGRAHWIPRLNQSRGGRGRQRNASGHKRGGLQGAIRLARSEAATAFGDSSVYLERYLQRPRHVEIQILADHHGNIRPFVERECSIQRRHQKVVEESPSPAVDSALRKRLADAASRLQSRLAIPMPVPVEFLVDEDGHFYFLEVNARLQVEHPVTEMVAGVDLVQWQIRIARGERLTLSSDDTLTPNRHAIECRVYAEDPDLGFLPSPGRILALRAPHGPGVRDDGWVEPGTEVPIYYDSLLSKVIVWGQDRAQATARMRRALREYEISGVHSTVPFSQWLLAR